MSINDKDSYGERQMNVPQCQIDTYHNMTKIIYIYIKSTILITFANMYLFHSFQRSIVGNNQQRENQSYI